MSNEKGTLVERLVRCYSPTGHEREAVELLVAEMEARGLAASVDKAGNAVGRAGRGPLHVYLIGHVDTVPGELPVHVKDGVLHGRGSVDAKGALAAFVEAAAAFVRSDELTVTVVGCVDEEGGSRGAKHLLRTLPPPDALIVGEPSGWDALTLGYKGSFTLRYSLKKPRAHAGAPEPTAPEEALRFYEALRGVYARQGVLGAGFEQLTLRLLRVQTLDLEGGNAQRVELLLNARVPPRFPVAHLQRAAEGLKGRAELEWGEFVPPVLGDRRSPLVRAFSGGVRALGARPRLKRKTGTSDLNLLQRWRPPLGLGAYGPGDSALDHTPEERLNLREYERAIGVLRGVLERLAATARPRAAAGCRSR